MSSWKETNSIKNLKEKYGNITGVRSFHALTSAKYDLTCSYTDDEINLSEDDNKENKNSFLIDDACLVEFWHSPTPQLCNLWLHTHKQFIDWEER